MKLVWYYLGNVLKLGIADEELGILDVKRASDAFNVETISPATAVTEWQRVEPVLTELLYRTRKSEDKSLFLDPDSVMFAPSVPQPGKVVCVGLNYKKHALESGLQLPEIPLLFSKFDNSITAHRQVVSLPPNSSQVDYEAELAIVIGKTAKCVDEAEAKDFVLGYTNANDLSARDLQFRTSQWLLGKSCDGFCPIGPYLVTKEEIPSPDNLAIRCYVNGELRQNSNTSDLIFSCDELVSFISHHMTLEPGDIILTGTPEGVAMGYPEGQQPWLKEGDEVVVEVEGLGRLVNFVGNAMRK